MLTCWPLEIFASKGIVRQTLAAELIVLKEIEKEIVIERFQRFARVTTRHFDAFYNR